MLPIGTLWALVAWQAAIRMTTDEHEITFGMLQTNGQLTNVRRIKQSDIGACPNVILLSSHYRPDGTCKCDDTDERAMMIREWEYEASDFEGPTRVTDCQELGTGHHEGATCGSRGIGPPFMCPPCQREEDKS